MREGRSLIDWVRSKNPNPYKGTAGRISVGAEDLEAAKNIDASHAIVLSDDDMDRKLRRGLIARGIRLLGRM